jgi:hypothetical protein
MLSALGHHQIEFAAENGEYGLHAGSAECGDSPHVWPPDANGAGAQCESFENIGSAAETAVDQYGNAVAYDLNDFRQTVDCCPAAFTGPSAVIGNDDTVSAILDA